MSFQETIRLPQVDLFVDQLKDASDEELRKQDQAALPQDFRCLDDSPARMLSFWYGDISLRQQLNQSWRILLSAEVGKEDDRSSIFSSEHAASAPLTESENLRSQVGLFDVVDYPATLVEHQPVTSYQAAVQSVSTVPVPEASMRVRPRQFFYPPRQSTFEGIKQRIYYAWRRLWRKEETLGDEELIPLELDDTGLQVSYVDPYFQPEPESALLRWKRYLFYSWKQHHPYREQQDDEGGIELSSDICAHVDLFSDVTYFDKDCDPFGVVLEPKHSLEQSSAGVSFGLWSLAAIQLKQQATYGSVYLPSVDWSVIKEDFKLAVLYFVIGFLYVCSCLLYLLAVVVGLASIGASQWIPPDLPSTLAESFSGAAGLFWDSYVDVNHRYIGKEWLTAPTVLIDLVQGIVEGIDPQPVTTIRIIYSHPQDYEWVLHSGDKQQFEDGYIYVDFYSSAIQLELTRRDSDGRLKKLSLFSQELYACDWQSLDGEARLAVLNRERAKILEQLWQMGYVAEERRSTIMTLPPESVITDLDPMRTRVLKGGMFIGVTLAIFLTFLGVINPLLSGVAASVFFMATCCQAIKRLLAFDAIRVPESPVTRSAYERTGFLMRLNAAIVVGVGGFTLFSTVAPFFCVGFVSFMSVLLPHLSFSVHSTIMLAFLLVTLVSMGLTKFYKHKLDTLSQCHEDCLLSEWAGVPTESDSTGRMNHRDGRLKYGLFADDDSASFYENNEGILAGLSYYG